MSPDGKFNVSKKFKTWTPHKEYTWTLLQYIKKSFYEIEAEDPYNEEAANLYLNDKPNFAEKVIECVNDSVNNIYLSRGPNNKQYEFTSLVFSKWNEEMEKETKHLFKKEEGTKQEEKKKGILSFFG